MIVASMRYSSDFYEVLPMTSIRKAHQRENDLRSVLLCRLTLISDSLPFLIVILRHRSDASGVSVTSEKHYSDLKEVVVVGWLVA